MHLQSGLFKAPFLESVARLRTISLRAAGNSSLAAQKQSSRTIFAYVMHVSPLLLLPPL